MGVVELPPGYTVREFRPEDINAFPGYRERLKAAGYVLDAYLAVLAEGACFTLCKDTVPVGCGGITMPDSGVDTAWFVPSQDVERHPRLHLAITRQFLAVAEHEYGLQAIKATADIQDSRAQNWLEHLGFTRDGAVLVNGRPHLGFVRVRR